MPAIHNANRGMLAGSDFHVNKAIVGSFGYLLATFVAPA
jgi:hypothetical protein